MPNQDGVQPDQDGVQPDAQSSNEVVSSPLQHDVFLLSKFLAALSG